MDLLFNTKLNGGDDEEEEDNDEDQGQVHVSEILKDCNQKLGIDDFHKEFSEIASSSEGEQECDFYE